MLSETTFELSVLWTTTSSLIILTAATSLRWCKDSAYLARKGVNSQGWFPSIIQLLITWYERYFSLPVDKLDNNGTSPSLTVILTTWCQILISSHDTWATISVAILRTWYTSSSASSLTSIILTQSLRQYCWLEWGLKSEAECWLQSPLASLRWTAAAQPL